MRQRDVVTTKEIISCPDVCMCDTGNSSNQDSRRYTVKVVSHISCVLYSSSGLVFQKLLPVLSSPNGRKNVAVKGESSKILPVRSNSSVPFVYVCIFNEY